jgi:hypothetical protein
MTTNIQKIATDKEAKEQLKAQLAGYLAQAPESTRSAHMWMKRVDTAWLGIVIAAFGVALYSSFYLGKYQPHHDPRRVVLLRRLLQPNGDVVRPARHPHSRLSARHPTRQAAEICLGFCGGLDWRGLHRGRLDHGRTLDRVRLFHRDLQPGDTCSAHEHSRCRHEHCGCSVYHLLRLSKGNSIPLNR